MQHGQDFAHHRGQTTGVAEVFHQVFARWLQVQDVVHFRAQRVEVFKLQFNAHATGNCQQVDHGIGRATDRRIGADGVLEGLARQDLRHLDVLLDHFHDAATGQLSQALAARVSRRNRRVFWQGHAQGLHHAGHGGGGAHGHAGAAGAVHIALAGRELCHGHFTRTHHLTHLPHASTRAHVFAAELAVEHRATRQADGGQITTGRTHHQRRRGLVAAHEQHHAVDGVAANAFLHIHRRQVAEQHRSGRSWVSPSDITGNSSGNPPASYTPRLTNSANSRKCPLQGVSSLQVLQIPMTGRPSSRSWG